MVILAPSGASILMVTGFPHGVMVMFLASTFFRSTVVMSIFGVGVGAGVGVGVGVGVGIGK